VHLGQDAGAKVSGWGVEGGSVVRGAAFSFDKGLDLALSEQIPITRNRDPVLTFWS